MTHALQFGKRAFIIAMIAATVLWAVGLSAVAPLTAQAATSGDLIKMAGNPSVYYLGTNGKRYVFPNAKTFNSWYSDFSSVMTVAQSELEGYPIGGNVTYKPGARLVKITTNPKVYAVSKGGVLLAIADEATAVSLYGANWNTMIDDVPDAYFVNYTDNGGMHTAAADVVAAASINADKALGGTVGAPAPVAGNLTVATASDSPANASTPRGAADVIFGKYVISGSGTLTGATLLLQGLAVRGDISSAKVYQNDMLLARGKSLNSTDKAEITFTTPIVVNGSVTLTVAADIAAAATSGNAPRFAVAFWVKDADAIVAANTATHSIVPTTIATVAMTFPTALNVAAGSTVDSGEDTWVTLAGVRFTVANNDVTFRRLEFERRGTGDNDDVDDLRLRTEAGEVLVTTDSGWDANGKKAFALDRVVKKGEQANYRLEGKAAGTPSRTIAGGFVLNNGVVQGATVLDTKTNTKIAVTGTVSEPQVAGVLVATTINSGTLTVRKSSTSTPAGNIPAAGTKVALGTFDFDVRGERMDVTQMQFTAAMGATIATTATVDESNANAWLSNCGLYDTAGVVKAGPADPTTANTLTFTDVQTLAVGVTKYTIKCDTASGADAGGTVQWTMVNPNSSTTLAINGLESGNTITGAPATTTVTLNTQTVQGAALASATLTVPTAKTRVRGVVDELAATLNFSATSSGENINVTALQVADTFGATAAAADIINVRLTDAAGADLATPQTTGTTAGQVTTYTFTLSNPLVVTSASDKQIKVWVSVSPSATIGATETHIFDLAAVTATGASTGTSVTSTPTGAGQAITLAASGSLVAVASPSTPNGQVMIAGAMNVPVSKFKFTAATEKIGLANLTFTRTAGADADVVATNGISLWRNGTEIGRKSLSGGAVTFNVATSNIVVEDGAPVELEVRVSFNTITGGATAGNTFHIRLDQLTLIQTNPALGIASGTPVQTAGNITANTHRIQDVLIYISEAATSPTTIILAAQDIIHFTITAFGDDAVFSADGTGGSVAAGDEFLRFTTTFSQTPTAATSFRIYRTDTSQDVCNVSGLTAATSMSHICDFNSNAVTVPENGSITFAMEVNTAQQSTAGNTVTTTLNFDTSSTTDTTTLGTSPTNNGHYRGGTSTTVPFNLFGVNASLESVGSVGASKLQNSVIKA